jgi:hypothetical protein
MRGRTFLQVPSSGRLTTAGLALSIAVTASVSAADFVIESRTYDGDHAKPFTSNTTVFHEGLVYDFVTTEDEITLLDPSRGRFVLMNTRRKIKTELTTDQVLRYTQHVQQWAAGKKDILLQFYADPKFDVVEDGENRLKLTAAVLAYEVVGKSQTPEIVSQYRQFCDWFARFNSAVSPGSQLPFPRLVLNNHLARRQLVPTQVDLTLAPQRRFGGKPVHLRSEHTLRPELTSEEIRQIDQTNRLLVTLKNVPLTEYRTATATAER